MEIKLYKSRQRALKLLLGCSVFVIGGIWLLSKPDTPQWIAWSTILFFGLGYPVGLYHLFDRRPQIIISESGIFDRMTHKAFINWELIQDAYLVDVHRQKIICLVVPAEFEPSRQKSASHKVLAEVTKSLGFQELNISLGQISIDETRFVEFILAMAQAETANTKTRLLHEFQA